MVPSAVSESVAFLQQKVVAKQSQRSTKERRDRHNTVDQPASNSQRQQRSAEKFHFLFFKFYFCDLPTCVNYFEGWFGCTDDPTWQWNNSKKISKCIVRKFNNWESQDFDRIAQVKGSKLGKEKCEEKSENCSMIGWMKLWYFHLAVRKFWKWMRKKNWFMQTSRSVGVVL